MSKRLETAVERCRDNLRKDYGGFDMWIRIHEDQFIAVISPILAELCETINILTDDSLADGEEITRLNSELGQTKLLAEQNHIHFGEAKEEIDRLKDALKPCPHGKADKCLDSPDGEFCACCGCVEMVAEITRLTTERAEILADLKQAQLLHGMPRVARVIARMEEADGEE